MKMKQKKIRKIGIASALGLVVLVVLGLYGASNYMLNYSLNYPKEERMTAEHWKNRMKNECPWMVGMGLVARRHHDKGILHAMVLIHRVHPANHPGALVLHSVLPMLSRHSLLLRIVERIIEHIVEIGRAHV